MKTQSEDNLNIKVAIEGLYKSFREKDHDGMISAMTDDVWIRFLGQADFKGIKLASDFFKKSNSVIISATIIGVFAFGLGIYATVTSSETHDKEMDFVE